MQLYNIVVNKYLQAYFWWELVIAPTVLHDSIGLSIVYIIAPSICRYLLLQWFLFFLFFFLWKFMQ